MRSLLNRRHVQHISIPIHHLCASGIAYLATMTAGPAMPPAVIIAFPLMPIPLCACDCDVGQRHTILILAADLRSKRTI